MVGSARLGHGGKTRPPPDSGFAPFPARSPPFAAHSPPRPAHFPPISRAGRDKRRFPRGSCELIYHYWEQLGCSWFKMAPNYYSTIMLLTPSSSTWCPQLVELASHLYEGTAPRPTPAFPEAWRAPVHSEAQPWRLVAS